MIGPHEPALRGGCAYCGRMFTARRRSQRYCKPTCRTLASRKRHPKHQPETPEQRSEHARRAAAARWQKGET